MKPSTPHLDFSGLNPYYSTPISSNKFQKPLTFSSPSASVGVATTATTTSTTTSSLSPTDALMNRLLVCTMAIILLWVTSLQVVVTVINTQFSAPTLDTVISLCMSGYAVVMQQQASYHACVSHELLVCNTDLLVSSNDEVNRMNTRETSNFQLLTELQSLQQNRSLSSSLAQSSIRAWLQQGSEYSVPYLSSCNSTLLTHTQSMLGDTSGSTSSSTSTAALSNVNSYTADTTSTMSSMSHYSNQVNVYNQQYLHNKTVSLHRSTAALVTSLSAPHLDMMNSTLHALHSSISSLTACLSLDSSSSLHCSLLLSSSSSFPSSLPPLPPSLTASFATLFQVYFTLQQEINADIQSAKLSYASLVSTMKQYESDVNNAIEEANSFFDSVAGANGLVSSVTSTLNEFGIPMDLCGSSEWCRFSKVRESEVK